MQIKTTGIILLRTCVDRLAGDGSLTIATEMKSVTAKGTHRIEFRTKSRAMAEANLEIKYSRIDILPPIGKKSRYPALSLTVIHANERGKPEGRDAVNWKLLTDLPVESLQDAIEKLEWYAQRWKIEMFHKVFGVIMRFCRSFGVVLGRRLNKVRKKCRHIRAGKKR